MEESFVWRTDDRTIVPSLVFGEKMRGRDGTLLTLTMRLLVALLSLLLYTVFTHLPVTAFTTAPITTMSTQKVLQSVHSFYRQHTEIKASHGIDHILRVYQHALKAIQCQKPPLSGQTNQEIQMAALLHDADDTKYFPQHAAYENAREILGAANVAESSCERVIHMISLVSCSKNGNSVPESIRKSQEFSLLIPRWADRLEAVGAVGLVRCFQYNQEHGSPMSSPTSPRAQTEAEVWKYATPARFHAYTSADSTTGGSSDDMISHYYDKLLHVACPPADIVRNTYLEEQAKESSKELVEMCLRFGRTGKVDVAYVHEVANKLSIVL
jgi:uncharacterized protein